MTIVVICVMKLLRVAIHLIHVTIALHMPIGWVHHTTATTVIIAKGAADGVLKGFVGLEGWLIIQRCKVESAFWPWLIRLGIFNTH